MVMHTGVKTREPYDDGLPPQGYEAKSMNVKSEHKRILIIGDESVFRRTLFKTLAKDGYNVFASVNIAEAAEFLDSLDFSLILVDIADIYNGGLDRLRHIMDMAKQAKVIVLIPFTNQRAKKTIDTLGAVTSLVKPIRKKVLLRTVARVLQ
ncbi:MAG TPA: response regulator [Bacteroidetes bacterium]|nr:response regulator [Bacteroidota bacterium]